MAEAQEASVNPCSTSRLSRASSQWQAGEYARVQA
jgi:hypothetical protein